MFFEGHLNAGDTPLLKEGELGMRLGWAGWRKKWKPLIYFNYETDTS